jgi:FKBP-type peptidyl-prolyl cis-trans isomerase FkpA
MRTFLLLAAAAVVAACNPTMSSPGGATGAPPAAGSASPGAATDSPAASMTEAPAPAASPGEAASTIPVTEDQKTIYALGVISGRQIRIFNLSPEEIALYEAGLRAAVQGTPPVVDPESFGPQFEQLARARTSAAAASFLDRAAQEEGAIKTASGFVFKSLQEGTGAAPQRSDTVSVNYRATMMDGREVDSSPPSQPAIFRLADVIPCWTEGVQMMKPGGKARLVCPPALAYGDRGAPPTVPGGSTLVFDIDLVEVRK